MDLIMTSNKKKKDWTKKYYKIIQELETMVDVQLQLQNIIKLATINWQASKTHCYRQEEHTEHKSVEISIVYLKNYRMLYMEKWNIKHITFKCY